MKHYILKSILIIFLSLLSTGAFAHHSFSATFDDTKTITVEGVVTKFSFRNPHVLVYMDVKDKDGKVVNWMSEGAAATLMRRRGWDKGIINIGDVVRVTGNATHDGSAMVSIEEIGILDALGGKLAKSLTEQNQGGGGRQQEPVQAAAPMPLKLESGKPNFTGAWTNHGMSDGRPTPISVVFNEAGKAMQEEFELAHDTQVFCDPPGLARQVATPHPIRITQYEDRVLFQFEEYGQTREVKIGDKVIDSGVHTHFGDAIARYDGDKLVIETINLLSNQASPEGNRFSDQSVVTETYSRIDDDEYGPIILIEARFDDPAYLKEPVTYSKRKMSAGEYEMIENDCQPPKRERTVVSSVTSFFLTSEGSGDGANLGGLAGADAHCKTLAAKVGAEGRDWKAYLSTTGEGGVNARDRIGSGPWYNSRGVLVAANVDALHQEPNLITKASVLAEQSQTINGRGDEPNRHDILTGSDADGKATSSDIDTTCANWSSNTEGSALVGHFDRVGGGDNPTSWNYAHASRGCSQENLQGSGGDGLFYCFAAD